METHKSIVGIQSPRIQNPDPFISVIIVTWNSAAHLSRGMKCLAAQTIKDFEVLLMDNGSTDGSTDGSLDGVENHWPDLRLQVERLGENKGFAAANNLGARLARGQWLALLNSDAFPEPDWLEELLKAAESHPAFSFFASRQLQANAPHRLDGAGDAFHVSGLAWRRFVGWPAAQFGLKTEEVFSPCGAAALYSRQVFLQAGGFDEDFFSYFEDVDLGFRLRLQGFKCLYVPDAVVHHIGSASTGKISTFVIYHGHRNLVWAYIKNMPSLLFWLYLPLHVLMNLYFLLSFSIKGQSKAIWSAKWGALSKLSSMLRKRKEIQRRSSVPVADIYRQMEHDLLAPLKVRNQQKRFLGGTKR
jgi:GT2 family glycosyltransferase